MAITDEQQQRLNNISCIQPIETIEPIIAGLSHYCFKVISMQTIYFVKLFTASKSLSEYPSTTDHSPSTDKCVNSVHHLNVQHAAYLKGLSAKVIEADEQGSYMVCEYIDGVTLLNSTHNDTSKLDILANVLVACHQLDAAAAQLDLATVIYELLDKCAFTHSSKQKISTRFNSQLTQISVAVNHLVLCHGDVNVNNIIVKGECSYLIDWEYCCLAEPEYDIAMAMSINQLNKVQQQTLLEYYQKYCLANRKYVLSAEKINRYLELCNIINALWFHQQPANIEGSSLPSELVKFKCFLQDLLR